METATDGGMWEWLKLYGENVLLTVLIACFVLAGHVVVRRSRPAMDDATAANKVLRETLEDLQRLNKEYRQKLAEAEQQIGLLRKERRDADNCKADP